MHRYRYAQKLRQVDQSLMVVRIERDRWLGYASRMLPGSGDYQHCRREAKRYQRMLDRLSTYRHILTTQEPPLQLALDFSAEPAQPEPAPATPKSAPEAEPEPLAAEFGWMHPPPECPYPTLEEHPWCDDPACVWCSDAAWYRHQDAVEQARGDRTY